MGQLERTIFNILRSFPENTLHTDTEIKRLVRENLPEVRNADFARAMCEIGRRSGPRSGSSPRARNMSLVWRSEVN